MYKKYAIISCNKETGDINFRNPFIRFFPKKMVRNYIIKKLPLNITEIDYLGNLGLDIKLPITEEELIEEEYTKAIIDEFNRRHLIYNINTLVISKELKDYRDCFESIVGSEKAVQFLYIDKVIKKIINLSNKELKDMNFVIIDGDNSKTRFIIDNIYQGINSLTIVTSKPEIFEERVDEIYDETGLAVGITNYNVNQEISSDIVINCNGDKNKIFYSFDEGSYIIDFVSDDDKVKDILIKRNDINVITGVDIYVDDHLMSKELLHGILLNQNRLLRSMFLYGYKSNMFERLDKIKSKYHVRIGNIYQRGEELQS
ncbi:hypothetical protein [Vallitalea guaymasensis]|uniref:hypothetical protein n=1 Tax=Vallitalea guaymasensis TaxID=1185412 RepID=UPI002729A467|nr:hypothetical protein [Vallitalea guaymasensis]